MITEIILILIIAMKNSVLGSDSIPVLHPYQKNITLKVGLDLEIVCPITSESDTKSADSDSKNLMFSWSVRDIDENIVATDPRYTFINSSRVARIRRVKPADSGIYKCRGVTGFGSQEAIFYVNILENDSCMLVDSSPNQSLQRPCFLNPNMQSSKNKIKTIHKNVGSSVEFRCDAAGNPKPEYLWFTGRSIADWINSVNNVRQPYLKIDNLRLEYTGHYTCRVSNTLGEIRFTFALVVKDSPSELPKIIEEMQNQSVSVGSTAELIGKIHCKCNPIIQWLQHIRPSNKDVNHIKNKRSLISLPQAAPSEAGEVYMTLDTDSESIINDDGVQIDTIKEENGIIVSKVKFKSVKPWHSGKYVLLTMSRMKTNVHEISYKTVFLNVLSDNKVNQTSRQNSPPKIIIYVAVPMGILILCIFLVFYCLVRRKHSSGGHSMIGGHSVKSKRSLSSNNHSLSIGGLDGSGKNCLKHNAYGTPALMTLTSSIHSNQQFSSSIRMNSNNSSVPPYGLPGQVLPGHTAAPAPSSNSSLSHNNSSNHKINRAGNNSSPNDSAVLGEPPIGPPSNSPYSYSSGPQYNFYHPYSQTSATTTSVPSNNNQSVTIGIPGVFRETGSNASDPSSNAKLKLNHSNPSITNNNPSAHNIINAQASSSQIGECHCANKYFIPDNHHPMQLPNSQYMNDVSGGHCFQLPPSLCFDTDSYPPNQYHSSTPYFPGHNSSSSASLTYS